MRRLSRKSIAPLYVYHYFLCFWRSKIYFLMEFLIIRIFFLLLIEYFLGFCLIRMTKFSGPVIGIRNSPFLSPDLHGIHVGSLITYKLFVDDNTVICLVTHLASLHDFGQTKFLYRFFSVMILFMS